MEHKKRLYRAVTFLNREELDFLDELLKDIYFSKGIKIPRAKLIEEIIEEFKDMEAVNKRAAEEGLIKRFKMESQNEEGNKA